MDHQDLILKYISVCMCLRSHHMEWKCKFCTFEAYSKGILIRHYKFEHCHAQSVPCVHQSCPCVFKTWSGLRTHLHRYHSSEGSGTCEITHIFKCKICDSVYSSTKDYFHHINYHLKNKEKVECTFEGCNFETNIYGTFATYATHKSRKHRETSWKDLKSSVISVFGQ